MMRFLETSLPGAYLVEPELKEDERGFFARIFCADEFKAHGLETQLVQCSISSSKQKGTLRGMHHQAQPYGEVRLVRCTMGSIFDVIIDLRPDSPTLCDWWGYELSAENRKAVYIPKGFAHGFITLEDGCEVFYQMSEYYHPESARGVRWNDPSFNIHLPIMPVIISERDRTYPDFKGVQRDA
jgi:dTDP-4-dehydrorhamnose 3,5-epimerase